MKSFKTLKSALESVTSETVCTCCNRIASNGYLNTQTKEGCVAMIHDNYSIGLRRELIRRWKGKKRITGIPGAGLLDRR